MATILSRTAEQRTVLRGVSWQTYESLLAETDRAGTRLTYDRGLLEIMAPSREHERVGYLLGRLIEALTEELGIAISGGGSTTLREELLERGVEADECYYIANESRMRGKDDFNPAIDPPPDLAIEIDITISSIDQLGIYAALGVPEVWICDGEKIRMYELHEGTHLPASRSPAFPFLPIEGLERFLAQRHSIDETTLVRTFREWVRTLPR